MAKVIDFFEPDDEVIWNKEIFGDEKNFPTLLTIEVYGEGPFVVSWADDVIVPIDIWMRYENDSSMQEKILKDQSYLQWIEVENLPGEWQGYFFRLVK